MLVMFLRAHEMDVRFHDLVAHCYIKLGVPPVTAPDGDYILTSGFTKIQLKLTDVGMHVSIVKTAGPPFGSHAEEGLKHGLITDHALLMPAWSVDLAGNRVKQVWLFGATIIPGAFTLSAVKIRDISKVEAVVLAMIKISQIVHRRDE